jgi:glycosyltransferase involved in cell wall biosynthesis
MSRTDPPVSVIVPTYNRVEMLTRAVESVLAQTYQQFEVVIVDDGSTDTTPKIFAQSKPPVRYVWQQHAGVSSARNRGMSEAKGDLIAFLDSDDMWDGGKLAVQVEFFEANFDAMVCQTQEIWIRNGVRVNPKKKHQKPSGWIFTECLSLCVVSPSAVMMRKSVFDEVGWFDERLPVCEDYDMWLRVALRFPIFLIDQPLVTKYGGHDDQLSHSEWGIDRYRVAALEKILGDPLVDIYREKVLVELRKKCHILSNGALKRFRFGAWMKYWWKGARKR